MNEQELKTLLKKFDEGQCSAEEIGLLENWYLQWQIEETIDFSQAQAEQRVDQIWERLENDVVKKQPVKLWPRIAAAAAILITLGSALFFYFSNQRPVVQNVVVQDMPAGGNKAYLTLADGKRITLTDAANGELAKESGVKITKSADGQVVYSSLPSGISPQRGEIGVAVNTISTPNGGQYQVHLPDGTKVWLNAASSLRFPSVFAGLKERKVELSGEAYFEVTHNKRQPFIVKTAKQEVEVLGTHFNINSYADEESTKTTLLQGAVLIRCHEHVVKAVEGKDFALLKPGEQCVFDGTLKISPADLEMTTAWKDGNFMFNDLGLQSIMKQLSRWYNVEVDYSNMPKDRIFTGFISRSENLSKVLGMLYDTGKIKFKLENKTIKMAN